MKPECAERKAAAIVNAEPSERGPHLQWFIRQAVERCIRLIEAFEPDTEFIVSKLRREFGIEPQTVHGDWLPIDTAPKDGTRVLLFVEPYEYHEPFRDSADWRDIGHWTEHNRGGWVHHVPGNPTHWQPAPNPPEGA